MEEDTIAIVSKRLSKALGLIESCDINELEWYFEKHPDYNDEVRYRIRDAARLLGYALATFTTWDEDPEVEGDTETKGFDTYYRGQKVGESKDGLYTYKATTITCDDKPYKVEWTMVNEESIHFGYYRSKQAAADVVSNMHFDEYVASYEVLAVWKTGKPYEIKNVGSFVLIKEEGTTDESKD